MGNPPPGSRTRSRGFEDRCASATLARILISSKCPRQESNLVNDLRRVVCESSTLQGRDQASPTGFEPVISTVTKWRALRTAPRGRINTRMAQEGFEPSASLVLSESGLPVAYRAIRIQEYRGLESNQRPPRSERGVTTNRNCPGVCCLNARSGRRTRTSIA